MEIPKKGARELETPTVLTTVDKRRKASEMLGFTVSGMNIRALEAEQR